MKSTLVMRGVVSRAAFSTSAATGQGGSCPLGFAPAASNVAQTNTLSKFSTASASLESAQSETASTRARAPVEPSSDERSRPPPSPALPKKFLAKFLGHAAFIDNDPKHRQSGFYRLFEKRTEWYKECGSKIFQVNLAGNKMVFCSDPAVYREVFGEKQHSFTNSNTFRETFGTLFPKSMIVLEGADWQRVRRVSQKALNKMDMNRVIGAVAEVIESGLENGAIKEGVDVDTFQFLSHLTFDVFHKTMYDLDPRTITNDPKNPHIKLLNACEGLLSGIRIRTFTKNMKILWSLPTKANRDILRNRDYIIDVGKKIVAQRRTELKSRTRSSDGTERTLLDGLILSQEEDILSDDELYQQITTFFFGAYETTSNTLLFSLNSLADRPHIQQRLRDELKKKFPEGAKQIANASLADLDSVQYLVWTLDESNRLHSTANGIPRDCISDVVVGGYEIKKGQSMWIDHAKVSRDPVFWGGQTDLDDFNPGRFEKFPKTDKLVSIPFGFGSRICPGRRIAIAEVKTVIAMMVAAFEILPPADQSKRLVLDSKLGLTCVDGTGALRFKKLSP